MNLSIFLFFITVFLTHIFLKLSVPFLRKNFLDIPNQRSSHKLPIPTSGGITFVTLSSIVCLILGNYLPLISTPLAVVGLIDDKYNIRKRFRFLAQLITVLIIIYFYLIRFSAFGDQLFTKPNIFFISFLIILGLATINFMNFMDGIDGLLSSSICVLIILYILLEKNYSLLPLVASLLVFSYWNWSPAKIFMGDIGSTFLGAILIGVILSSSSSINALKILIASSPLMGDACITVIRRFFNRDNIFRPHKKQLFQRLVASGISHNNVSLIYLFCTLLLSISSFLLPIYIEIGLVFPLISLYIYLDKYKAISFKSVI